MKIHNYKFYLNEDGYIIACSVVYGNDFDFTGQMSQYKEVLDSFGYDGYYKFKNGVFVLDEERKAKQEEFWNNVEVGKKYKGIVTSLSSYGAFVDLGVTQGLLHVSEISWDRNAKVDEILKQGQEIEVTVIDLDKENKRIKLSYGDKGPNPWNKVPEKYHVGDIVKVKVVKMMPFGVFVELEPGIQGLVHISQIAEKKIAKPEEELKLNQNVNAKIIEMDLETQRIELSIKELEGTSNEYKEEI